MRGRTTIILTLALGFGLGACKTMPAIPQAAADASPEDSGGWRATATEQDRARIRNWYDSWEAALADARAKGHTADLAREGVLLQPMAALPNPHLPEGEYRCRTIKVGSQGRGGLGYIAYGWFRCRVSAEQGLWSLIKLSGSQRPVGLIFPDNLKRQIFLGTLELGDEGRPVNYGSDRMRDMAGLVERIGDNRWRLVLPAPAYESLLDVIELAPAA
ncbi:MAG: DUF4893 domain-containing protein [Sphingopyxis sp.]|uniref:DUF4893 domain-containing protein n=1 Tax=Sphingopyxis sp. TaxID=1908224 RepID=UPI003D80E640